MSTKLKIIIQIILIIGFVNYLTYWFPTESQKLVGGIEQIESFNLIAGILSTLAIVYIVYWMWKFDHLEKKSKYVWTFYMLAFTVVSGTIYLWKKDERSN